MKFIICKIAKKKENILQKIFVKNVIGKNLEELTEKNYDKKITNTIYKIKKYSVLKVKNIGQNITLKYKNIKKYGIKKIEKK